MGQASISSHSGWEGETKYLQDNNRVHLRGYAWASDLSWLLGPVTLVILRRQGAPEDRAVLDGSPLA